MKKTAHILVIEDAPIALKMAEASFSALGAKYHTAETGKHALELMQKYKYDLILLDLGLPDIRGIEILNKIKEMKLQTDAFIVILTGHSDNEYKKQAFALGAKQFIQKPLTFAVARKLLKISSEENRH